MIYLTLAALTCAFVATLLELSVTAAAFAFIGEVLFVLGTARPAHRDLS